MVYGEIEGRNDQVCGSGTKKIRGRGGRFGGLAEAAFSTSFG